MCLAPTVQAEPITGKLTRSDLAVIAVGAGGKATSKPVQANGAFRLRAPSRVVTLHLRDSDGTYAGPVVAARASRSGSRVIVGVTRGADLGLIQVRGGYAKTSRRPAADEIDRDRTARARDGVPIGARRFGRVRSRAERRPGPGLDGDHDGIPGTLDVDDDGDLVLDPLDRGAAPAMARLLRGPAPTEVLDVITALALPLEGTANANVPGATDEAIEAVLPSAGALLIEILPGGSPELDCGGAPNPAPPPSRIGGLGYCSTSGTGTVQEEAAPPFPDCCDADADGFGGLTPSPGSPPPPAVPFMFLNHGATTDQIATGDVVIEHVQRDGAEVQIPTMLPFVFATVPALVSYGDTAGNAATVDYPVSGPTPGPGDPGTQGNGFPISAGIDGDVVLTLTFWRPQRRPIEPEAGNWIDIGGLAYSTVVHHVGPVGTPPGGTPVNAPCPPSAYSTTDPSLGPPPPNLPNAAFIDLAPDRSADPDSKVTYTLNLSDCLAALSAATAPGDEASISLAALTPKPGALAGAGQSVWFAVEPE